MRFDIWQTEREQAEVVEPFGVRVLRQESRTGAPFAKIWRPRATRPEVNYVFRTVEQREGYIQQWIGKFAQAEALKAERKAAAKAVAASAEGVAVGTIFCHSWGYDQTNIDFYQVVRVTASGKTVVVKAIGSETVPGSEGYLSGRVIPRPGAFLTGNFEKELRKTVQFTDQGEPYLAFEYGWCGVSEPGKSHYSSSYA